jgi:hypothetical protein
MGNISATTFADRVVGDSITELFEVELYGMNLSAGSPIFSRASMLIDLREGTPSKTCYKSF